MRYSFTKFQLLSRWVPSSKGESLLHLVADSSCEKKGNLLLERIMAARWPCWANSFQKTCFQAQIVTDTEINCENMQAVVGSVQGALKPGDGADKDVRGVGAESVVASAAPSELSGLCASLAWQVQTYILNQNFTFPISCIVAEEDNVVHFDFFLFHQQNDDNCELTIMDLVGFHLSGTILHLLLFF